MPTPRAPLPRRLTVGPLSVAAWLLLLLALLPAMPVLLLISLLDGSGNRPRLRSFGGWCLRMFFVRFLSAIRYHRVIERPDAERIAALAPCVMAANHRSWLDGLLAMALFPGVLVPVNASYLRIPLLGPVIRRSGVIALDRNDVRGLLDGIGCAGSLLAEGYSLLVFPEGTRGPGRGIGAFSDLFFRLARDRNVPVVPVVMHSDTLSLSPGAPGLLPWRRAGWRIRLLEPVLPDRRDRPADVARRVRAAIGAVLEELDGEGANR